MTKLWCGRITAALLVGAMVVLGLSVALLTLSFLLYPLLLWGLGES
jgi:hypothetical protein